MTYHPRDRRPWNQPLSRRNILKTAGAVAGSTALASCGGNAGSGDSGTAVELAIGSPENPATLPLLDDIPPIDSNLQPEPGPLKIYNWADYLSPRVMNDFSDEYGVEVELTTFYNMEEATRKLATGDAQYDVFFPYPAIAPKFVAGKILQPLNLDYIPNLQQNVWPMLADPYYDQGSRYTVPYVVYETGIAWRTDMIPDDIAAMENPWEALWNPDYAGKVGLYDDYRETIGVGMFKNGIFNVNAADPDDLATATASLIEANQLVQARYGIDNTYVRLPEGKLGITHAWSGDVIAAPYYMPKGDDSGVLRYAWPPKTGYQGGYIANDLMTIPKNAESPVLAHHFLNYMLDEKVAINNFSWVGYQPPLNSLTPQKMVKDGLVVPNLESAITTQEHFKLGQVPLQLEPADDAAWLKAWSRVQAGG